MAFDRRKFIQMLGMFAASGTHLFALNASERAHARTPEISSNCDLLHVCTQIPNWCDCPENLCTQTPTLCDTPNNSCTLTGCDSPTPFEPNLST